MDKFKLDDLISYLKEDSKQKYKSIALQFPDSLLVSSTKVYRYLKTALPDRMFYVLGDT